MATRSRYTFKKQRQKGAAAIWMALSLVPIFGFTFWAVEGTRYVQESSRLKDASEAGVLAITITDQEASSTEMAASYIKSYGRGIDTNDVHVMTQRSHLEADATSGSEGYVQYQLKATTNHDSWFTSSFIPSFEANQDLVGQSIARKVHTVGEESVDLVLVTDFSASMLMHHSSSLRITYLKEAVAEIMLRYLCDPLFAEYDSDGELENCREENGEVKVKNTISIVPFSYRTQEKMPDNSIYQVSQLRYSTADYETINWQRWNPYRITDVISCAQSYLSCPAGIGDSIVLHEEAKVLRKLFQEGSWSYPMYPDVPENIDFKLTIEDMFTNKLETLSTHFTFDTNSILYWGEHSGSYYTLEPTNNRYKLANFFNMTPEGTTSVYHGILRGLQMFRHDSKNKPVMIVISDGEEYPIATTFNRLVEEGLCDEARKNINDLYIGVIGLAFDATAQANFLRCVEEEDDIIDVHDLDLLLERVNQLILGELDSTNGSIVKLY